jgi:hypothetical protein
MKRSAVKIFWFALALTIFIPTFSTAKEIWAPRDCMVIAEAIGGGLRIKAHTPEPVQFWISVSYNEPNSEGSFVPTIREPQWSGGQPVKDFVANFPLLQHETMYYYVVKIFDMDDGLESYVVGAKWTNVRSLEIILNQLDMHDDSDDFTACDFRLEIKESGKRIFHYGYDKGDDWIATGETVYPNRKNFLKGVNSNFLDLWIVGLDDDDTNYNDSAAKRIKIGYSQQKAFHIRVNTPLPNYPTSSTLDFTVHFSTKEWFNTPANTTIPDLSHLQPKPRMKLAKVPSHIFEFKPDTPIIKSPRRGQHFTTYVMIGVSFESKYDVDPVEAIKFTFHWFNPSCGSLNNPNCWEKKIIAGWQAKPAGAIPGGEHISKFKLKGLWRMRVRAITKAKRKSDWSPWRHFKIE